jgi:predicted acetyltransferase
MRLRTLAPGDEGAFLRALERTAQTDPNFVRYHRAGLPFAEYLRILQDVEAGRGLPPDHVASTTLFGFVEGEIVGRLMFRHLLNDVLLRVGGHIGYVVVPEFRRRGYSVVMLRQGLDVARAKGLTRVLLTCDEENLASRRTIEICGGQYEDSYSGPEAPATKRRYWIAL